MKKRLSLQLHFLLSLGIRVSHPYFNYPIRQLTIIFVFIGQQFKVIAVSLLVFMERNRESYIVWIAAYRISSSHADLLMEPVGGCVVIFLDRQNPHLVAVVGDCSRLNGRWNYFAINKIKSHLIDRLDLFGGTNGVD